MSGDNSLIPRTGQPVKLLEGPRVGQRSLYQQQVLDEDTYTDALSHIITRDFFPNLPHLHATNAYLTALSTNDPELLSSSIRRLAALAQEKEDGRVRSSSGSGQSEDEAERMRRRELEMMGTPYISTTGRGRPPARTPVGARGWDTPLMRNGDSSTRRRQSQSDEYDELEGEIDPSAPGPSKRRRKSIQNRLRDDLPLDAFQRNYTSEDNASFVHIVDEENKRRREDRWGWAFEAEKKAEMRRLEGEEKRKMILEAATSGGWRVDGNGRRMIGGLAQGGAERLEGEAWKEERKLMTQPTAGDDLPQITNTGEEESNPSSALITLTDTSGALVESTQSQTTQKETLSEKPLPPDHPLHQALTSAGLPTTALVSPVDGTIIPYRELVSGEGEGRGRGQEERERREKIEKEAMGSEEREALSLGGSGADLWGYKTRNNFYFSADANSDPYPKNRSEAAASLETARQAPKEIKHSNTRLPEEEEVLISSKAGSTRRGSSPARSWVDAAVKGTPYHPKESMPTINSYPLLPSDPSPSPTDLPSLLTWGTLLSTPRALDGSSDPLDLSAPTFRMPETKKRDELGRKLADKASRSMNARAAGYTTPKSGRQQSSSLSSVLKQSDRTKLGDRSVRGGGEMLPPSLGGGAMTPKRQAEGLTPAGRRLLERSLGKTPGHSNGGGLGLGLKGASGGRGAAMEKGAGWGGGKGGNEKRLSWTPSPAGSKRF